MHGNLVSLLDRLMDAIREPAAKNMFADEVLAHCREKFTDEEWKVITSAPMGDVLQVVTLGAFLEFMNP